ncbi:MAG: dienelactone hydrolase family protein [Acutalibacteraceae bacterium]|nr:dienelactone hydrolase family protein [Acutalibacteraceae bacterium]
MKIIRQEGYDSFFPYIAYVPDNLSDHPALLIQLHGAGERGNGGSDVDKVLVHGFSKIVNDDNLNDCILIMPQCPPYSFWAAKVESIKKFIDEMTVKFSADTNRIYLCGLSMGGFGTWYTAMAYPELFAAIAPCCGGGMAWNAGVLKMPIWTFHGLADDVVSPNQTIEMIEALKGKNPNLKYDLYEGVGHDSWNKAFSEQTLNWILSHKKAE